jgi:hypothetical protein
MNPIPAFRTRRNRRRPVKLAFLAAGILWGVWSGQTDWLYYPTEAACRAALAGIIDEGVLWVVECRAMTDIERRIEAERQWPDPRRMKAVLGHEPRR